MAVLIVALDPVHVEVRLDRLAAFAHGHFDAFLVIDSGLNNLN